MLQAHILPGCEIVCHKLQITQLVITFNNSSYLCQTCDTAYPDEEFLAVSTSTLAFLALSFFSPRVTAGKLCNMGTVIVLVENPASCSVQTSNSTICYQATPGHDGAEYHTSLINALLYTVHMYSCTVVGVITQVR